MQIFYDSTLFTIIYASFLAVSLGVGYWVGSRNRNSGTSWSYTGLESGMLSFFGIVLSFSLYVAGNASRARNSIIIEHATSLEILYNEALFSSDSVKAIITRDILTLIEFKLQLEGSNKENIDSLLSQSESEHIKVRARLKALIPFVDEPVMTRMIASISSISSLHYQIRQSYQDHEPMQMVLILLLGSLLVGVMVGLIAGANNTRNYHTILSFYFLTLFIVLLIHDMNNPDSGKIRPSFESYRILKHIILKN